MFGIVLEETDIRLINIYLVLYGQRKSRLIGNAYGNGDHAVHASTYQQMIYHEYG